jgi:hypothetical protein
VSLPPERTEVLLFHVPQHHADIQPFHAP